MRQVTIIDGKTVLLDDHCEHDWVFIESKPTDSDTVIDVYLCSKCKMYHRNEVLGSVLRDDYWRMSR